MKAVGRRTEPDRQIHSIWQPLGKKQGEVEGGRNRALGGGETIN